MNTAHRCGAVREGELGYRQVRGFGSEPCDDCRAWVLEPEPEPEDVVAQRRGHNYRPTEYPGPLVYVASPYTKGSVSRNVRDGLGVADALMDAGYAVIAPLANHLQDLMFPRSADDWLGQDLRLVECCDVVLRLPGESNGADIEVAHAQDCDIPVAYGIDDLLTRFPVVLQ